MKPNKVWLSGYVTLWLCCSFALGTGEEWVILRSEHSVESERRYQSFSDEELQRQIAVRIDAGGVDRHVQKMRAELARRGNVEERKRIFTALYNTVAPEQQQMLHALLVMSDREAVFHLGELLHHPGQRSLDGVMIGANGKIYDSYTWFGESIWKRAARVFSILVQSVPTTGMDARAIESYDGERMQLWHDWWRRNRPQFQEFFAGKLALEKDIHRIEEIDGLRSKRIGAHTNGAPALILRIYKRVEMLERRYEVEPSLWTAQGSQYIADLLLDFYEALSPYNASYSLLYLPQSLYEESGQWGDHAEITYFPQQSTSDRIALLLRDLERGRSLYQQGHDKEKWYRVAASRTLAMLLSDLIPHFLDFPQTKKHLSAATQHQMEDLVRLARLTRFWDTVHRESIQTDKDLVGRIKELQGLLPERVNKQQDDSSLMVEMIHACALYLVNQYEGGLRSRDVSLALDELFRQMSRLFYLYARQNHSFGDSPRADLLNSIYTQGERFAAHERSVPVDERPGSGIWGDDFRSYSCEEGNESLVREIYRKIEMLLADYEKEESLWNARDIGYVATVLLDFYETLHWHQNQHSRGMLSFRMVSPMRVDEWSQKTLTADPVQTIEERVDAHLNLVVKFILTENEESDYEERVTAYDIAVARSLAMMQASLLPRFLDFPQTQQYLSKDVRQVMEEMVLLARTIHFLNEQRYYPMHTPEDWIRQADHIIGFIPDCINKGRKESSYIVAHICEGIGYLQAQYWKKESLQSANSAKKLVDLLLLYSHRFPPDEDELDGLCSPPVVLLESEYTIENNKLGYYAEAKKSVYSLKRQARSWLSRSENQDRIRVLLDETRMQELEEWMGESE